MGNEYDKIIEDCTQALKNNPNDAEAYLNRGVAYLDKGNYDKAIEDFNQAIRIKPDYDTAHYNLGWAYVELGNKNSAMEEYQILKDLDKDSANELFKLINK